MSTPWTLVVVVVLIWLLGVGYGVYLGARAWRRPGMEAVR